MHGDRAFFSTGVGFPQGGVCSAKFWLIAFNYAIHIINKFEIEGNGYADDCSALYGGRRLDHALKRLQRMLNELVEWGKTCGLTFNPEKSVAIIFTRRRKQPPFNLKIDGKEIPFQQEVKYLGVTLDSKLHWNSHINDKVSKAKKFLAQVANITQRNWGPKPRLMRWAYLGIVRPMLCYGSMIWGHRAPALAAKLRRVNRMALNTFASFPRSTPTEALEVALDVMPLHLFCLQSALGSRIRQNDILKLDWDGMSNNKLHNTSHLKYWNMKLSEHGLNVNETDRCNTLRWNTGFKINRDSFSGHAKHRIHTQFNIYTDGSKQDGGVGSGFVIYNRNKPTFENFYKLPDHATVFQAEITAIEKAASTLVHNAPTDLKFVKFFIDSQAAILALANPTVTSKAVAAAMDALNELSALSLSVTLTWIPAHKGHEGNELADTLAKRGAASMDPEHATNVGVPAATTKREIKDIAYAEWSKEWKATKGMNHAKTFYSHPDPIKAKYVYKLARLELGRFIRIISGHNNLRFFQTKIGLWNDNQCRLCGRGFETLKHLLHDCPYLEISRRDIFLDQLPTNDMKWSVRSLLEFSFVPCVNEAYEGTWAHGDPLEVDDLDTIQESDEERSDSS